MSRQHDKSLLNSNSRISHNCAPLLVSSWSLSHDSPACHHLCFNPARPRGGSPLRRGLLGFSSLASVIPSTGNAYSNTSFSTQAMWPFLFFFFLLSHLENKWEEYLRALTCGPLKAGMSQPTEDAQYAGLSDSLLGRWAKEGADLLLTECNRECPLASLVLTLRSISFCEEFFCRPFIQPDQGLWKIT